MKIPLISWNRLQRMVKDSSHSPDYELEVRVRSTTDEETQIFQVRLDEQTADSDLSLSSDRDWLINFEQYILDHLDRATLSVPDLAHAFAMSESTLLRQMKRLTGLSPLKYLQQIRMEQAYELLLHRPSMSIAQVASSVGYQEGRSFTRRFKAEFGVLPTEVRLLEA